MRGLEVIGVKVSLGIVEPTDNTDDGIQYKYVLKINNTKDKSKCTTWLT